MSAETIRFPNKQADRPVVGRFAPSPTGRLHSGSLATAVGSFLMAKRAGGRWLLRIDDLDTQRQIPGMADDIMRTLEACGLQWDGAVARQSRHQDLYRHAFDTLQRQGVVFPCRCSRKELTLAASAPAAGEDGAPYPGTCRVGRPAESDIRSWRLRVGADEICFDDLRCGSVCQNLERVCGDFAIRRGVGEYTYQLAVVVDDYLAGVTQVVRGEDLCASTPRQIYLQRLLGYPTPQYCHLPLVTGPDGTKLSKRDHLVSHSLGTHAGREPELLLAVLRFLGLTPPGELRDGSNSEILEWGCRYVRVEMMPRHGGVLPL